MVLSHKEKKSNNSEHNLDASQVNRITEIKRHGDLLIVKIEYISTSLVETKSNVLAVGETTGHSHKLNGQVIVYENINKDTLGQLGGAENMTSLKNAVPSKLFVANSEQYLVHEEHKPLKIEPGVYAVINEREYDPFAAALAREKLARELEVQKAAERTVSD